jgi:hypothetical protein
MAITNIDSGTQTCVITTVHTLVSADTTVGIFVASFNLDALVKGDEIKLSVWKKVLTSDTERILYMAAYGSDMGNTCIVDFPPFVSEHSFSVKIQQTAGTGRTIPWSVIQVG